MKNKLQEEFNQLSRQQQSLIRLALFRVYGDAVYQLWGQSELKAFFDRRLTIDETEQGFVNGKFDADKLLDYHLKCLHDDESVNSVTDLLAKAIGIENSIIKFGAEFEAEAAMDQTELAEDVAHGIGLLRC